MNVPDKDVENLRAFLEGVVLTVVGRAHDGSPITDDLVGLLEGAKAALKLSKGWPAPDQVEKLRGEVEEAHKDLFDLELERQVVATERDALRKAAGLAIEALEDCNNRLECFHECDAVLQFDDGNTNAAEFASPAMSKAREALKALKAVQRG